jgi:hypothetical protein
MKYRKRNAKRKGMEDENNNLKI